MKTQPPRLAVRLLRSVLPATVAGASTLGDLTEEYHRRPSGLRRRAWFWLVAIGVAFHYAPSRFAGMFGGLRRDFVYTLRMARRAPAMLLTALVSLSLAIGLGTATFTVANATWLRSQLAADPALVKIWRRHANGAALTWPTQEFAELQRSVTRITLEGSTSESFPPNGRLIVRNDDIVQVLFVTGGYLSMVYPHPALGRLLTPGDDAPGAPPVIVLSHLFWRRSFGGDPSIVGRTMSLSKGPPLTVVGIADRDYIDPSGRRPSVWVPLGLRDQLNDTPLASIAMLGRLKNPEAEKPALEELTSLVKRLGAPSSASVPPATEADAGPVESPESLAANRKTLAGVFAIVAIVLLLACANVSNLHLARAASRRQEIAVRLSCGASRRRVVRQLITESAILATVAGAVGFLVARAVGPALATGLGMPGADLDPDVRVYTFAVLASAIAAIGSGLAPALYAVRDDVAHSLKGTTSHDGGRSRSSRARAFFVGVQAASSIVLVAIAALLVRTLVHIAWLDPGFDVDHLVSISAQTPRGPGIDVAAAARDYWTGAAERIRAIAGVDRLSIAEVTPFGVTHAEPEQWYTNGTDAEFFATLGLRVVRGRTYRADEVASRAPVLVLSEQMARQFWGQDDPIGATASRISKGMANHQVIGVVTDALTVRVHDRVTPVVYYPLPSYNRVQMAVIARDPTSAAIACRDTLASLAPNVRTSISVVSTRFAREFERPRQYAALAASVAFLSLGLAVVGLLGVTTLMVRTRTREIGLRMALGAKASDVVRLLLKEGMRPVAIGLVAGLVVAVMAGQYMAGLLYGLSPRDPLAMFAATAVLLTAALIAVLVPTRRAARLEPARVLREG